MSSNGISVFFLCIEDLSFATLAAIEKAAFLSDIIIQYSIAASIPFNIIKPTANPAVIPMTLSFKAMVDPIIKGNSSLATSFKRITILVRNPEKGKVGHSLKGEQRSYILYTRSED